MVALIVPQENIPVKKAGQIVTIAIPDSTRTNPVSRVAKIATRVQKELPN